RTTLSCSIFPTCTHFSSHLSPLFSSFTLPPPPTSTLFPYTTLFRSYKSLHSCQLSSPIRIVTPKIHKAIQVSFLDLRYNFSSFHYNQQNDRLLIIILLFIV